MALPIEKVWVDGWCERGFRSPVRAAVPLPSTDVRSLGWGDELVALSGRHCTRINSSNARATTFVARRRSASSRCSSARLALDSRTVRGPAP